METLPITDCGKGGSIHRVVHFGPQRSLRNREKEVAAASI